MTSVPIQAISATKAQTAHSASSRRAGRSTGRPASRGSSRSAWSRTSRAGAAPDAGTMTSRGPAASMSGTSNPRERRSIDGTPSSSSRPWISSASAWLRAPATRTRSPSLYCGLILRARACAAETGVSRSVRPAYVSGIPHRVQNRSSAGCRVAQLGHTSGSAARSAMVELDLADAPVVDPVAPDLGVRRALSQPDDEPLHAGPAGGEVDVGLRRVQVRARVRVVDRAELAARVLDRLDRAVHLEPVDLEAQRAAGDVLRLVDAHGAPVAHGDHPAALVREVAARVLHHALDELGGDVHAPSVSTALFGLDGGALVVVALVLSGERVLELAHALAERLADLGQLLRAQHDEGDGEDDDELHRADVRHPISWSVEGSGSDPTPVRRCSGAFGLPPDRGVEVLDLLHGLGVDAARQELPAVVADDEDDVALVELARDAHRDRRDRAGRDAGEEALLVEQLARPHDGVVVRDEDLPVEQAQVDDRRDEPVVERAQALDRLAPHGLGGDDLHPGAPPPP